MAGLDRAIPMGKAEFICIGITGTDPRIKSGDGDDKGEHMKTRAAVAFAAGKPLEVVEIDLEGPRAGEVLVEVRATGICHTDAYTLSGADPD